MSRLTPQARPIPVGEEGFLGTTGFTPAHTVANRRVTGRHRLTVDTDLLSQPSSDVRLRISELDALGVNPAVPADDAPVVTNGRAQPAIKTRGERAPGGRRRR
jgi:hypothetical protein